MQPQTPIDLVVLIVPLITLFLSVLTLVISLRLNREQTRLSQTILKQKERLDDIGSRVRTLERHL
jgi:cell division protein FtsL